MNRDEQIEYILDRMRSAWAPTSDTPDGERAAFESVAALFPEPQAVRESPASLSGVDALAIEPDAGNANGIVLYLHGGAFALGSSQIYREQSARIAHAAGVKVINVDYRLAPEHPYPAAVEDTLAAYRTLLVRGVTPDQIVVAGDSAGANLALALCLRLRGGGEPMPAGLVLISPWVDLTCGGPSIAANANPRHLAQRQGLLSSAVDYLAGHDARDPLASPLFADLSGLPPMLIQVGSAETLLDDARELARRASAAGVPVDLEIWEDMFHEWHLFSALLPAGETLDQAEAAVASIGAFIRDTSV